MLPLQGIDFVTRMFKAYDLDTIALLHTAGWDIDRILILTVSRMNRLGNAVTASNPTPDEAPIYADFVRVAQLMRELQKRDALFMGYAMREEDASDPLPPSSVTGEAALAAAKEGYSLRQTDAGSVLRTSHPLMQLRVSEEGRRTPEWAEICDRLGLARDEPVYEFAVGSPAPADGGGAASPAQITISTRSLLGTLFLLSHAVQTPERDRDSGIVTVTRDAEGREIDWADVTINLLKVHSQKFPPARAAVTVRYRDHWFHIRDDDRNPKSTFMLLNYLFALQAGQAEGKGPVLTLPVGR
jgi:hypothetical protein